MKLSLLFFTRFRAVLILGAILLAQGQSNAAIRYVRANGTNNNPATATTWATSTTNLQGAINASNQGDQVWVATGTYKPGGNANTDRTISFTMKNWVTIYGGFASSGSPTLAQRNPTSFTTVLSGDIGTSGSNTDNTIFIIRNNGLAATAVLDGFVIRDGNSGGQSFADYASGMYNYSSSPLVTNCSFQNNSGYYGAAMSNRFNSNPAVTNCSFQNNSAEAYGGGMYNDESSPTVTNCSFQGNSAYEGGGMSNSGRSGSLAVTNCSFQSNSATQGGAMINYSTTVSLTNCVVFGNGEANTIVNSFGSITASYSLFETSVTGYVDGGNNLTTRISPFVSTTDARLNGCSLAINTGNNAAYTANGGSTTDLTGNPRFFNNGVIDRGAYEYQAAPTTITVTAPSVSTATIGVAFSQPFTTTGGTSPYSYSLVSGSLPTGLSLASTGVLSGTPTQSGSFTITVRGRDANGCSDVSEPYRLTVSERVSPIRYVKAGGAGNRSGNSWADASDDLQSQIDFAGAQQVWVATGTYKPGGTANTDRPLSFAMRNGVSILGGFAASGTPTLAQRNPGSFTTVLSGNIGTVGSNSDNSLHVINNGGLTATAVLDGFIIRDGNANDDSIGNSGGGMYNNGSSPTVTNCSFLSNSARYGGGVFNQGGSPALINCSFLSNSGFYGGGMNNSGSSPSLTNCSFLSNSASAGGGIFNFNSNPSLTNCVLYGNGGANTFTNGNSSTSARYSLLETTVTNYTDGGNNLTTSVSPFISSTDARLNGCSPAINTGLNSANATTTDLAGNLRIFNSGAGTPERIDMGAYEYQAAPTAIIVTAPSVSTATIGVAFSQNFTATGGTSPYSYTVASGSLPAGLSLAPTGVLSGTPTQSGSFTITVRGRDANGCSGISAAYVLTVSEPASVMLTGLAATPNTVCVGSPVTFTTTVGNLTGSYSYTLTNGLSTPLTGSASGTLFSQSITANATGTQRFTLTVTANGQSASSETPLTVNPLPVASLTSNGPLSCAQSSVTLTANPNGQTYQFSAGTTQIGSSNQATVSTPGLYSVTVISGNGCSDVASVSVSQDITPPVATISGNLTLSNGGSTTLTASGGTAQTWSTGETTPSIVVMAGTYSVTVTNASGCSSATSVTVSLAFGSGALSVLHQDVSFGQTTTNTILPYLQLVNSGSAPIAYSTITVRYWLTVEGNSPITNFQHYYVQIGGNNVHEQYVPLATPRQGATAYVEYSFDAAAGNLVGGTNSGPIQNGFSKGDYSAFNQSDDYSYVANRDYTANAHITAYVNGFLVYGQEPSELGPVAPLLLSLTANSSILTTSGTTTLSATVSGGTTGVPDRSYSYSFTGPGTISPSGNTASVSNLPAGVQTYYVVVRDATSPTSQTISGTVSVTVNMSPANTAPVATANNNQTATVGVAFTYTINAFTDAETPNQLTYSASINPANGFSFDPATRIISGTPSMSGVSSVMVTATDPGSLSASTTFTITVSPAPVVGNAQLTVLHQDVSFGQTTTNTILPYLQLVNSGSAPIAYSAITVRYWLTVEGNSPISNFQNYYVQIGGNNVHEQYVPLATPRQGSTAYVEYSFDAAAGNLAGGTNSGPIQNGFSKADYSAFNQSDDYSYVANRDYTANAHITAYVNGFLVYGQEPPVGGRLGVQPEVPLSVVVLGNPVRGETARIEVRGAQGQPLRLTLVDERGRVVTEQAVPVAGAIEYQTLGLGHQPSGILLLRVSTPTQSQTIKLLRSE